MTDYAWKDWPENCPECGGDLQVFSSVREECIAMDGDKVRCKDPECGTVGQIDCDFAQIRFAGLPIKPYVVVLDWDE